MELRDLQIFKSVAHHKSITGAAKELSYVQSNVTARIKQLENELKTPLFNRHKKGVSLSPEGRKMIEHVNKILKDVEELKQAFLDSDVPSGILKIGTVETVRILPTILASYYKKYPNVDLSLQAGLTEELIKKVTNQELDGAFISGPIKHSILEQYDVYTEKLTLVTTNKTFNIEDFLTTPILVSNRGCGYRSRLEHWLQDEGLLPNRILEFNILETILNSVALGLGITVVPESAVRHLSTAGKVYCHPLPEKYSCISTVFIRHKDAYLTNSMRSLLKTIVEHKNMSMS
ncbi:LysR family transcriptional regulator [Bacillus inaquosorum]|uniref:LysR family transcriptional regulator n=2 Tax=Bacillus inaquosorum TaxID=483913 RepID=A0A9Q4HS09_9BACI|nr:LysR family transcriptional regulator [Bacillus inaquosorum]TDO13197.1 DNA-binding transcriptional LysR family regulator [Bacillus subtilis]MCY7787837.1 LysR family transcriptional regulator [Bacillus inaquosorum]MCY7821150.1 LysR family transcriptional regulator [Bacillus inaquosorum]MCY7899292.1 LysR family transcriptional regulator [Bacillus inaquosorum]MCY7937292.1 LysR family transcriptional regulator [Bacillus inaquosorum]